MMAVFAPHAGGIWLMSDDYFIEVLLKPEEHEWLMRALLSIAVHPLMLEENKKKASDLHDKLKEQFEE